MGFLQALLLAIVQGATEFLPISSSGHLVLGQFFLGIEEPQLLFDIVLHVGTLLAIVAYYRRDVLNVFLDTFEGARAWRREGSIEAFFRGEGTRLAALVVLATIPTGLIGVALEKLIDPEGGERVITAAVVFAVLIVNGFIMMSNRWMLDREVVERRGLLAIWNLTPLMAILVGVAQGLAVMPGISRSGTTITVALALGIARPEAARFSFLLSVPAILGALVLKFDSGLFLGEHGADVVLTYLTGAVVAGLVGFGCLHWLVQLLKRARFHHFAWYCWAVGIMGLVGFYAVTG